MAKEFGRELRMTLQEWADHNGLEAADLIRHLLAGGSNAAAFLIDKAQEHENSEDGNGDTIEAFKVVTGQGSDQNEGKVMVCTYEIKTVEEVKAEGLDVGESKYISAGERLH